VPVARFTSVEMLIDRAAHGLLDRLPESRAGALLAEFLVFGAKQAWASLFGALLLIAIVATRALYPDDAVLARNDLLTILAVLIQIGMLVGRLETIGELRVILLFHLVGTVMELFKTDVGSWTYSPGGVLHLGAVPLFSGFMYAAVGSYMVRVVRLFDIRFERYPRRWLTALVAVACYVNFFTHHYVVDVRWLLFAAIVVLYWPTVLEARVLRARLRLSVLVAFVLVALFIWIAENVATAGQAWIYPDQADGWTPVSLAKLGSWILLMMISVVLVTWVYPPQAPDVAPPDAAAPAAAPTEAAPTEAAPPDAAAPGGAGSAPAAPTAPAAASGEAAAAGEAAGGAAPA
jgi:uncharacterized membrane protein YoaT (DUF817 family)